MSSRWSVAANQHEQVSMTQESKQVMKVTLETANCSLSHEIKLRCENVSNPYEKVHFPL